MQNIVAIILGGGRGTRLYPLTKDRAKPSVPMAGKFRLIDIPMSNCLHSGLEQIYILTQFNSASLNSHIAHTYQFDSLDNRSVRLLAAEQTFANRDWYQGTADAVRQNYHYLFDSEGAVEHVLVLAGDHLYQMDYRDMIAYHLAKKADITVGAIPVDREQTGRFGILKAESDGRVINFVEKPQTEAVLNDLATDFSDIGEFIPDATKTPFLASMGIYIFKVDVLTEKLTDETNDDFGQHIIPEGVKANAVYAYPFNGYWEDIGTIKSFYEANLKLLETAPEFDFYDESKPIYTYRHPLPGAKVTKSNIAACILADGAIVNRSEITRSIVGIRGIVLADSQIEDSIVMGADYYESADQVKDNMQREIPPIGIGSRCLIRNAIIDKNAHIGDEVTLINQENAEHTDAENYYIRDSIIIVPKNAVIPSGTVI